MNILGMAHSRSADRGRGLGSKWAHNTRPSLEFTTRDRFTLEPQVERLSPKTLKIAFGERDPPFTGAGS